MKYDPGEFQHESALFANGLSIPCATPNDWPIDVAAMDQQLGHLATLVTDKNMTAWLATIPDAEIIDAKDEILEFVELLNAFQLLVRTQIDLPGLWIFPALSKSASWEPLLLLGWLLLRTDPEMRQKAHELTGVLREAILKLRGSNTHAATRP
jgi:hypothetical protein